MGEKPLYYGLAGKVFLFGSELKALCAHPRWQGDVDREALALFLQYNYVPTPYSISLLSKLGLEVEPPPVIVWLAHRPTR